MKDKSRLIIFLITCLIMLIVLPVLASYIRDIVEVYKFNFTKVPEGYILKKLMDKNTYIKFLTIKDPPNVLCWIILGWYILGMIINSFGLFKVHEKYIQNDEYGSHGTARWQTDKEIQNNFYKDSLGWFLGSIKEGEIYKVGMRAAYHPVNGSLNMQITVIGPPGSNKTTGFVLSNIFHLAYIYKNLEEKADLIITDPKSELYSLTSNDLENNGYDVFVLDFIHLMYGDSLNSLNFISEDKELMEIAQGYVDSIEHAQGGGSKDAFWGEQEAQVLAALMGLVLQTRPKEKQTFTEISKILTSDDVSDIDKARDYFKEQGVKGAALQLWNNFLMIADSERTRANILGGLATKLKLFAIEGIQNITNHTTVDISKLGRKKEKPMAIFIFMPDSDRTFSPIINVTVSTIFKQLYKTAYTTRNRLEFPVYFILEEMANIGKISGIQEMLGTMRGRRIYPMMIWQSLAQMKDRYKEGWEDIMSMCDTHVYLGVNDEFTANKCSNSLGDTTIKIQGMSQKAEDGLFAIRQKTESQNYQKRKLLLPDECMRMDNGKLIIRQRANNPCLLNKVQYKYWLDNVVICKFKEVSEIKPLKHKLEAISVNNITVKETEKDYIEEVEQEYEIKDVEIELENNNDVVDFQSIEIDNSLLEELNSELEIKEYDIER